MTLNSLIIFGLSALAVWRLTSMLFREDGPFDLFVHLRRWIGVYYDEFSDPQGKNVVAKAFTCLWCLSVWVSIPFSFFVLRDGDIYNTFIIWLALSATAIWMDESIQR